MTAIEYSPWHTPHTSDPGAVHRAITGVSMEYGRAAYFARHAPSLADEAALKARTLAYFVVSQIGDSEVCDLERHLEAAAALSRETPDRTEEHYRTAIEHYLTPD